MTEQKTLYDTREAAIYLGLAVETVRRYVQTGRIKSNHRNGKAYLFTEQQLLDFQGARRERGNPNWKKS